MMSASWRRTCEALKKARGFLSDSRKHFPSGGVSSPQNELSTLEVEKHFRKREAWCPVGTWAAPP